MYRWLNIYVYWNDTLEIWINNVRVYNGTSPTTAAEYTAPQGFTAAFDPDAGTLAVKYPSIAYTCRISTGCSVSSWTTRTALTLPVGRGNATQWSGWVKMINTPAPTSPVVMNNVTWNVMPAGPYVGRSGGFELFGVVPPFEVYSVYAAVNGSGLVVRMGDPNCGVSEQCIRTFFYPQPGTYRIDTGINAPAGMPVYVDSNYIIAVTSTFRGLDCARCATIGWYVPRVRYAVIYNPGSSPETYEVGSGPYTCYIRTDGFRNTVPFEGRYWQIECGYYDNSQWKSLGAVKLVFNNDYTVSVYKDGQYLYNVRVNVCTGFTCVGAPTQRIFIPVSWGPDGIAVGVAQFRYNRHSVGYGEGVIRVRDVQTVATPFYYRYNLTGAYPYKLDVQITTAEKEIARVDDWIYINVTYSGYLKLYLGDQLVAYDALYGWTIRRDYVPPPPPPVGYGEPAAPGETCVTQRVETPVRVQHSNLQKGDNSYTATVQVVYKVREFGCGIDRTYEETRTAGTYTVNGNSYHTTDPNNKVCGYQQAQNCGNIVYCGKCKSEQSG
jgi:hypothetical protein